MKNIENILHVFYSGVDKRWHLLQKNPKPDLSYKHQNLAIIAALDILETVDASLKGVTIDQ